MSRPIFKVHCSSIGSIMTEPRSKKDTLSATCKTYIESWMKEQLYSRRAGFRSKYTSKGNDCEPLSIDFASEYYGWGMVDKNTETKENEFLIGTCDINLAKLIVDIKNSWSEKTFPIFETVIPEPKYEWQGLGYMDLWKKPKFQLTYTLMDAPEHLIDRESRQRAWELGMDDVDTELYNEVKSEMTYSNLHPSLRIKSFLSEFDEDKLYSVYDRVIACRKYIETETDFYELYKITR